MFICRRTPRPTVGSTGRWGPVPAAMGHGGKIPTAAAHGGKALAPWATVAAPLLIRDRAPAAGPSLTPLSPLQTFGFQPFGALLRYVSKFSPN
jgi:hypothetical protein